ncbi:hypothetical protein HK100_002478 [Physocladia obscura]|uniref:Ras GEF n=1 Tax=Physocladia obscura TaxID=109957 RepID=A0AAD5T7W9_9FUNG|nr:hypothetical protein HK100_002478 [Physocladia obscura]
MSIQMTSELDQPNSASHARGPELYVAKFNFDPVGKRKQLPMIKGDVVKVHEKTPNGWWRASINHRMGWIPSNFVSPLVVDQSAILAENKSITSNGTTVSVVEDGAPRSKSTRDEPSFQEHVSILEHNNSNNTSATMTSNSILPEISATESDPLLDDIAPPLPPKDIGENFAMFQMPAAAKLQLDLNFRKKTFSSELSPPMLRHMSKQLPPHWGERISAHDGKKYYFNYISDKTTWNLSDINHETGDLVKLPKSLRAVQTQIQDLSSFEYPKFETAEIWADLIQEIARSIQKLDDLVAINQKDKYTTVSKSLIENMRIFLLVSSSNSTNTAQNYDEERLSLINHHAVIMGALSKLAHTAMLASALWAPPDSTANMIAEAANVLVAVRAFANSRMKSEFKINEELLVKLKTSASEKKELAVDSSDISIVIQLNKSVEQIQSNISAIVKNHHENNSNSPDFFEMDINHTIAASKNLVAAAGRGVILDVSSRELVYELQEYLSLSQNAGKTLSEAFSALKNQRAELYFDGLILLLNNVLSSAIGLTVSFKFLVLEKILYEEDQNYRGIREIEHTGSASISPTVPLRGTDRSETGSVKKSPSRFMFRMSKNLKTVNFSFSRSRLSSPVPSMSSMMSDSLTLERPWYLDERYNFTNISFTSTGAVRGGTLVALVELLTHHESDDTIFMQTFLLTYRSFTTAQKLFHLLKARFLVSPPATIEMSELTDWELNEKRAIQKRVFSVLNSWTSTFFYEIDEKSVLVDIMEFAKNEMKAETPTLASLLFKATATILEIFETGKFPETTPLFAPLDLKSDLLGINFTDLNDTQIAKQITHLESTAYSNLRPFEFLEKAYRDEFRSPNVRNIITLSNQITGWVIQTILSERDIGKRVRIVRKYIVLAENCLALKNFSSLTAIIGGLSSSAVFRLRNTWDGIGKQMYDKYKSLKHIMGSEKNFATYRDALRNSNGPCVPYLGIYLTDLTFIDDGNADYLRPEWQNEDESQDSPVINFSKRAKAAEVIRDIQKYQQCKYELMTIKEMELFLNQNLNCYLNEEELFTLSLEVEARETAEEHLGKAIVQSGLLNKSH